MIDKIALLTKFDHWCIPLYPLYLNSKYSSQYVAKYPSTKEVNYLRDKGVDIHKYNELGEASETVLVISGDIDRNTHPLSKDKLQYSNYNNQIMTTHTIGYSPWDFTNYIDYTYKFQSDINIMYLIEDKLYNRFSAVDWSNTEYPFYQDHLDKLNKLIDLGRLSITNYQPIQYDIWHNYQIYDNLSDRYKSSSDRDNVIGVALNWCNISKSSRCKELLRDLELIHNLYPEKKFVIKNHHNTNSRLYNLVKSIDYIEIYSDSELAKEDFISMCNYYLVDDTSLGYEISYIRNKLTNDNRCDIYYIDSFSSIAEEFQGVEYMGDIRPKYSTSDIINESTLMKSDYNEEVISESFPHDYEDYKNDLEKYPNEYASLVIDVINKEEVSSFENISSIPV